MTEQSRAELAALRCGSSPDSILRLAPSSSAACSSGEVGRERYNCDDSSCTIRICFPQALYAWRVHLQPDQTRLLSAALWRSLGVLVCGSMTLFSVSFSLLAAGGWDGGNGSGFWKLH